MFFGEGAGLEDPGGFGVRVRCGCVLNWCLLLGEVFGKCAFGEPESLGCKNRIIPQLHETAICLGNSSVLSRNGPIAWSQSSVSIENSVFDVSDPSVTSHEPESYPAILW